MKDGILHFLCLILMAALPLAAQDAQKFSQDFKSEQDPAKQYALIKSMAELNNPALNSLFLEVVEGPYAFNIKREALQGIEANSKSENMIIADRILAAMQKDKDELVVEGALNLLCVIGSAKYTSAVVPYLSSSVITVREAAAKALYSFGSSDCIPSLKELLAKETGDSVHSKNIRKYAMLTIGRFKDTGSIPELETAMMKSIGNRTNQDESIYAVNAIRDADTNKAKDIVSRNTNLIASSEVRENLMIAADLKKAGDRAPLVLTNQQQAPVKPPPPPPDLAQPKITEKKPENTVRSNIAPQSQPEKQPEKITNVPPVIVPSEVQFDLDSVRKTYPKKEDALAHVSMLSNLTASLVGKIERNETDRRYYGRAADITFRMAEIVQGLKDPQRARLLYDRANTYYQKLLGSQKGGH